MKSFYSKDLDNVSDVILDFLVYNKIDSVIDLGCGCGDLAYVLSSNGLLPVSYVGVDINPESCKYLKRYIPSANVICADMREAIKGINETFDLVVNEQVIEHIEDDNGFLQSIHKLMDKSSKLYISSVIRKRCAWWFHRYKGEIRICPDHIREYRSKPEFLHLLERNGFRVLTTQVREITFIPMHSIDRLLVKLHLVSDTTLVRWYSKCSLLRFLRKGIVFPIPGFYTIEVLAEKGGVI